MANFSKLILCHFANLLQCLMVYMIWMYSPATVFVSDRLIVYIGDILCFPRPHFHCLGNINIVRPGKQKPYNGCCHILIEASCHVFCTWNLFLCNRAETYWQRLSVFSMVSSVGTGFIALESPNDGNELRGMWLGVFSVSVSTVWLRWIHITGPQIIFVTAPDPLRSYNHIACKYNGGNR